MGRVFILGAGASHFAGYPLGPDLWAFIRDSAALDVMARDRAEAVKEAMESILQRVPLADSDRPDLEQLFTFLDLAQRGTDPLVLRQIDWWSLRPKVMGMIAHAFQWYEYQLQERMRGGDARASVLDRWAKRINDGDTIVTFNWDLLHEAEMWRRKKWHYSDGYGFTCEDAPVGCHSSVRILKLHGSVNWGQRDEQDCEPAIEHKSDFFRGASDGEGIYRRAAGQWSEGRFLIVPSYLKDLSSNRLLVRLWNQAFDALATAEQVTVIGFRLHPADALARQLFACALTRNMNPFAIRIVSPIGGDHWDDFCYSVGRGCERSRMRFEEWV